MIYLFIKEKVSSNDFLKAVTFFPTVISIPSRTFFNLSRIKNIDLMHTTKRDQEHRNQMEWLPLKQIKTTKILLS